MSRIFVHCEDCNDTMEVYNIKGRWICENCGKDLTKEVDRQAKNSKKRKSKRF
jgi:transposase-like protein